MSASNRGREPTKAEWKARALAAEQECRDWRRRFSQLIDQAWATCNPSVKVTRGKRV